MRRQDKDFGGSVGGNELKDGYLDRQIFSHMDKPKVLQKLEEQFGGRIYNITNNQKPVHAFAHYEQDEEGNVIGLSLSANRLPNLLFLGDLHTLKWLKLNSTRLKDYSPIATLPKLDQLELADNQIKDIQFLQQLTNLSYLNLSQNPIGSLSPLRQLTKLQRLNLRGINQSADQDIFQERDRASEIDFDALSCLPVLNELHLINNALRETRFLSRCARLHKLTLDSNPLSDLRFLENQSELIYLSLDDTQRLKKEEYQRIQKLSSLKTLSLAENDLENVDFLRHMTGLEVLDLEGNEIERIDFLAGMTSLKKLILGDNMVSDISPIAKLTKLKTLNLSDNSGIKSYECIAQLPHLESLYLNNNNISHIQFLENSFSIKELLLNNNIITDISPLKALKELKGLDLQANLIENISPIVHLLKNGIKINSYDSFGEGKFIFLKNNPLEHPPSEIIEQGSEAVRRYFQKIQEEGSAYIYEAKLTLVGDGSAGKTSLQIRLLDSSAPLPKEDVRTRGIQVSDWVFDEKDGSKCIAHIWDFGGQDVYYPVHRFFLTENAVFVLLASTRQPYHNFDYWIPTIFQFGGPSPIILGQTCHEGNRVSWNDIGTYISNNHFNIVKTLQTPYYEINLKDGNQGLEVLRSVILHKINALPHFGKSVPRSWLSIREDLFAEAQHRAGITFIQFIEICNRNRSFSREDAEDLGRFLHSLGIILWYADNEELRDWVILQPGWAMNAVYRIIDDPKIQERSGLILPEDFNRLWNDDGYTEKHFILKKMLEVFKIAFPQKHNRSRYLIPARLPSISTAQLWPAEEPVLRLEYHFSFMPRGLVNQLSSELSRLIVSGQEVWNNAVNLQIEASYAQVLEDLYDRKIYIKAKGPQARGLNMVIMNALTDIIAGYKGVQPDIVVPCTCNKCRESAKPTTFSYAKLVEWSAKKSTVRCNEGDEDLSISRLLSDVGLPDLRKEQRKTTSDQGSLLKAFISYSKSDAELNQQGINYLADFKRFMVPLSNKYNNLLQTWDDTNLIPGDKWDDRIREELLNADIIFLLISSHFLNTDYIRREELIIAAQRQEEGQCLVVPIILSPCGWGDIPLISQFNALPHKGIPISSWQKNPNHKSIDDAWQEVYEEVKKMLKQFQEKRG